MSSIVKLISYLRSGCDFDRVWVPGSCGLALEGPFFSVLWKRLKILWRKGLCQRPLLRPVGMYDKQNDVGTG